MVTVIKAPAHKLAIVAAIAAGIALGVAVTVLAQGTTAGSYWYSGADLMSREGSFGRALRVGYAAGAADMLAAILSFSGSDDEHAIDLILSADSCIAQRSGGTLGQFTDWAESLWRGRREPAAKVLLMEACR